jgi:glyoxylase-like metal-dependent hydrolase (beta-lactamase superfamily II)
MPVIVRLGTLALGFVAMAMAARQPALADPTTPATELFAVQLREVVPGVHVASRAEPLRPYVEGNVTLIVNDRDVVVVDAGGSPAIARNTIAALRRITSNPVSTIVLTHIHRDHRLGLQEYLAAFPGVEVVAHPIVDDVITHNGAGFLAATMDRLRASGDTTREQIASLRRSGEAGDAAVARHLERYAERDLPAILAEYEGIRNLGPTATVDQGLTLVRGERRIEIRFLGRGDTDHDLIVYLPREKVAVTGDMVVHPFPYGYSSQPREWVATLRRLAALDIEHLVPGHGQVQRGEGYLERVIALVDGVQQQVSAAVDAGLDLPAVRTRVDLSRQRQELVGDDPVGRHYFAEWFAEPAVRLSFEELRAQRAE